MSSTRVTPSVPDLSGVVLDGRYALEAIVGEGTFGRVYRARDRRLARPVAVKVIKPWWAEDPAWLRAFERETQLLASLSHPGIVAIFDVGAAPEGHYLVSELVDGGSLARRLADGPLPPGEARRIAADLCRALGRAHADRIVHRDVKPENVLITREGTVKVGDFGIARLAESTTEAAAGTIIGTPRYMAPEQARGGPVSPATDVYAAGVVLYEMLTGHPPFAGSSAVELALQHVSDPPPPLPPGVPDELASVVERALAKQPGTRFTDGAVMARALERPLEAPTEVRAPAGPLRPAATPRRPVGPPSTHVGNPRSSRRNVNPSERRQRVGLLGLIGVLIGGAALIAVLGAPDRVRVPSLAGLTRHGVDTRLRRAGLHPHFSSRYSAARPGTAIAESPTARSTVDRGSTVGVVLSAGPPPVTVPALTGQAGTTARADLARLGLAVATTQVPAPGAATGAVVGQSPAAGTRLPRGRTVALRLAAPPRWRVLTALSGTGDGRSVPFRIRGRHWRLTLSMTYSGTCTFIFFCNGPSAQVMRASDGQPVDGFDLGTGTDRHRLETSGPGVYAIRVVGGSDVAHWRIGVEDRY